MWGVDVGMVDSLTQFLTNPPARSLAPPGVPADPRVHSREQAPLESGFDRRRPLHRGHVGIEVDFNRFARLGIECGSRDLAGERVRGAPHTEACDGRYVMCVRSMVITWLADI